MIFDNLTVFHGSGDTMTMVDIVRGTCIGGIMAKVQSSNTMVRFDVDVNNVIRDMAKHKKCSISTIIRNYVYEGMGTDDNVGIDENGNFFYDPK